MAVAAVVDSLPATDTKAPGPFNASFKRMHVLQRERRVTGGAWWNSLKKLTMPNNH